MKSWRSASFDLLARHEAAFVAGTADRILDHPRRLGCSCRLIPRAGAERANAAGVAAALVLFR